MKTYTKDPAAKLDYKFDWTAYLTDISDTIASVQFEADPSLTTSNPTFTTNTATVWVAGGVVDSQVTVTCRITTAAGRIDDRTILLKIKET